MLFGFEAHDLGRDVFQRPQQFASALGQEHRIRPGHLHVNLAGFKAIGITGSRTGGDPVLQSQAAGGGKSLEECCNLLSCSRVVDDRHRFSIALCAQGSQRAGHQIPTSVTARPNR